MFSGDTLFLAGCGRFFEGTADQMNRNLNEILAKFPDETVIIYLLFTAFNLCLSL